MDVLLVKNGRHIAGLAVVKLVVRLIHSYHGCMHGRSGLIDGGIWYVNDNNLFLAGCRSLLTASTPGVAGRLMRVCV